MKNNTDQLFNDIFCLIWYARADERGNELGDYTKSKYIERLTNKIIKRLNKEKT